MNTDFNCEIMLSYLLTYWISKRRTTLANQTTNPASTDYSNTFPCSHSVFAVLPSYEYYMHRLIGLEVSCFHRLLLFYISVSLNYQLFEQVFSMLWIVNLAWTFSLPLKPTTRIPPQASHTETTTHIETWIDDQHGDTTEKSQARDDGCSNVPNMLSIEEMK